MDLPTLFYAAQPLSPLTDLVDILAWITDGKSREVNFKLFDDVSMVYELQLAKMEFSRWSDDLETFRRRAAYFEGVARGKELALSFVLCGRQRANRAQQSIPDALVLPLQGQVPWADDKSAAQLHGSDRAKYRA